jgi:geranylgeranyl pyrophosphate synthase
MSITTNTLITKIFLILDQENPQTYIQKFNEKVIENTLQKLILELDDDEKKDIQTKLQNINDIQAQSKILIDHFDKAKIAQYTQESSEKLLRELLDSIDSLLTSEQKEKLTAYFQSISQ